MQFLQKLRWKLQSYMCGRYGMDKLSTHLYYASLVLWAISLFVRSRLLSALFLVLVIFSLYRCFSKNIGKRNQELMWYLNTLAKIRRFCDGIKRRWRDRKIFRYFKCSCGSQLRVPKGKGKIEITCPKCHKSMIRRT